ncbi:MAG: transposase [Pseudodesulfovibrio sp.]
MSTSSIYHAFGILAYYDHPISSGPIEGTNNKIKTLKRQAGNSWRRYGQHESG